VSHVEFVYLVFSNAYVHCTNKKQSTEIRDEITSGQSILYTVMWSHILAQQKEGGVLGRASISE